MTADSSKKEQLPLVLHFVDATNSVREGFIEFILCDTGTSGNAVAGKILEPLEEYGLNVCDQGLMELAIWLESTEVLVR